MPFDVCTCIAFSSNGIDRKSTRLNSSHQIISYAVFCLKKKKHSFLEAVDFLTFAEFYIQTLSEEFRRQHVADIRPTSAPPRAEVQLRNPARASPQRRPP